MSLTEKHFNPYGLRARLGLSLALSAVICITVFFVMNAGINHLFSYYFENSDFEARMIQRQCRDLQIYVDDHHITIDDLSLIKKWENKQPLIFLELYTEDKCIYSSIYDASVSDMMINENIDVKYYADIYFGNQQVKALMYSDFSYQYSVIGSVISFVVAMVLFFQLFLHNSQKMIRYICRLNEEVHILEGGNLEYRVSEEGNDEITDLARSMNTMRVTLQNQMEREAQLYQKNRQLITEMSHDLRTPLTGMMLYLEILRSHRYSSEEQLQDYLEKIDAKAYHMKLLTDHLFEYAIQDYTEQQTKPQSFEKTFEYELQLMTDELKARGFFVESFAEWKDCYVHVNTEYVHRIFENIISNIEKYAERSANIVMDTVYSEKYCGVSVINTIAITPSHVDSNGVGIESIQNMMKQMNGMMNVEQTDMTFEITLLFPRQ